MADRTPGSNRPSESEIRRMVEIFYARVREDSELGPIFERRIGGDWAPHLDRMVDFWTTVLLASGRYRGNPRKAHDAIAEIRPRHFDRWLTLFGQVLDELFEEHVAADILGRARRMRVVLEGSTRRPA